MHLKLFCTSIAMILISCAVDQRPARAEEYVNPEWGLTIPVPPHTSYCQAEMHPEYQQNPFLPRDRGPTFVLDKSQTDDCSHDEVTRNMGIFAFHNVLDDTRTLPMFARSWCKELELELHTKCRPGPADLKFGPLKSIAVRIDAPATDSHTRLRGWVEIRVYAQGEVTLDDYGEPANINYIASLTTGAELLDQDLPKFRAFLSSIKVVTPPR